MTTKGRLIVRAGQALIVLSLIGEAGLYGAIREQKRYASEIKDVTAGWVQCGEPDGVKQKTGDYMLENEKRRMIGGKFFDSYDGTLGVRNGVNILDLGVSGSSAWLDFDERHITGIGWNCTAEGCQINIEVVCTHNDPEIRPPGMQGLISSGKEIR